MEDTNLEHALSDELCPSCGIARRRPSMVQAIQGKGDFVLVDCRNPRCDWRARAKLPGLRKILVYLDSSLVSHMVRALQRRDFTSKWGRLYEVLRDGALKEVISCPGSCIVEDEATLAKSAKEIVRLSKEFADSGLEFRSIVEEAQVFRAVRRFLSGEEATPETDPPESDAFKESPHHWQERFRIDVNMGKPEAWRERLADSKKRVHSGVAETYARYRDAGLDFAAIREFELAGYGKGQFEIGQQSLEAKMRFFADPDSFDGDPLEVCGMSLFEKIAYVIERDKGLDRRRSYSTAAEFLLGRHLRCIPAADIGATLHASVAWAMQGDQPRQPSPSDSADIAHLSVYLPYFDIFVADRFFANACRQKPSELAAKYGTEVFRTGDVEDLIEAVSKKVEEASQVALVERVHEAIRRGGYAEEEAARLEQLMKARGWTGDRGDHEEDEGDPC